MSRSSSGRSGAGTDSGIVAIDSRGCFTLGRLDGPDISRANTSLSKRAKGNAANVAKFPGYAWLERRAAAMVA